MPESEKRELGGLARSIDALFEQARPAPAADEPAPEGPAAPAEAADADPGAAAEPVQDAVSHSMEAPLDDALALEPDPFESLETRGSETAPAPVEEAAGSTAEPESSLSFADVDVPQDVVWETVEADAPAEGDEPAEPPAPTESDEAAELPAPSEPVQAEATEPEAAEAEAAEPDAAEPDAVVGTTEPPVAQEPTGPSLLELVEAYLTGEPGAADDVRALAAEQQERMALDALADAVEALVHSNGDTPSADAIALAQDVIDPAVASRLVQRMGHEDDDEKRQGYVVLAERLGTVMAKAFRGALTDATDPRARRAFYDALIAMGEVSRPMIEAMVEDDNRFLVRNAVAILGEIGGERAIELVTSALANTDARVRREALLSLAKLGGDEAASLVMGFLEDPDAEVRAAAAEAAGSLKVERSLKPILGLLETEGDPEVLVQVLRGLGRLGDPGAVQAIEKRAVGSLFSKPVTEVRVAAYRALHDIGTPHARDVIAKAKDDKDPVVRTTTRQLTATD